MARHESDSIISVRSVLTILIPVTISLVMVIATVVPVNLSLASAIALALPLIPIYFWSVHRPGAIPAITAFAIGLCHDLIGGHPLGLNALILVAAQWATTGPQGQFLRQGPIIAWYGFFLITFSAAIIHWLIGWFVFALPNPFPRVMGSYLVTAMLYPFIAVILYRIDRLFGEYQERG